MCTSERLSYSAFPAGHIFRLAVAILVLTGNCVVMRVAATIALLSIRETQSFCRQHETACGVTAFSVLGSLLPILISILTGAFAIVAAKRYFKWAFIVTFVLGCILMTISFLLNLLFNGLRHNFNIAPVLIPDILEIILFCVINLLSMVLGILCVKSLVKDRSERYAVDEDTAVSGYINAAEFSAESTEETNIRAATAAAAAAAADGTRPGSSSSLAPPSPRQSGRMHRSASRLSGRGGDSRVEAEVTVVVENESGKVTNFDIFTVADKRSK